MKVLLWIAGGLMVTAMGGTGRDTQSNNGIVEAGLNQSSAAAINIQDPEVIHSRNQILQIEQRLAALTAQEVIHNLDLENILFDAELAIKLTTMSDGLYCWPEED